MALMINIPTKYNVGGQDVEVRIVDRCDGNSIGECRLEEGYIEVARLFAKDEKQSVSSMYNTFLHELVHSILRTMGEHELNNNEKFVCGFASFLCEALTTATFE